MKKTFFMTRREKFKDYFNNGLSLKFIGKLMPNIHYQTLIRWEKLHNEGKLLLWHGLQDQKGNKTSIIDEKVVINEYLTSIRPITTHDSYVESYTFAYFVENKLKNNCSLPTFRNIMTKNLIASSWATRKTRKTYKKLIKKQFKQVKTKDEKEQLKDNYEYDWKILFEKATPWAWKRRMSGRCI